jgi:putative transposase
MSTMPSKRRPQEGAEPPEQPPAELVDRLAELLPEGALDEAVRGLKPEELSGPGGLLSQLAGRVVEAALEAEMTEHLGHPPGGPPQGTNVRNGATAKTVQTDLGPVEITTPRDRQGSFEPQILPKRQTRLAGLDDKVLGLYAGGMTVRDISAHLSELSGTEIGRDTISRITDAVLEDVAAWRSRPLDRVYPIVYVDAMTVKVREDRSVQNRAGYLALGVSCDGEREVLGIWWQETEGAKFWLAVLNDLRRRGVDDVLISCVDGLKQTCIVHLIRASLRYVNYRDKRKAATALRPIYTAPNADTALDELERFDAEWGERYPATVQAWRASWENVIPFLSLPDDLRRAVYTTDESVKGAGASTGPPGRVSVRGGRGRSPSEVQDPGLSPAARLAPQRASTCAPRWRRPRPTSSSAATRRRSAHSCARPGRRARLRDGGPL